MVKRFTLLIVTNLMVMTLISIIISVLGIDISATSGFQGLAFFCFLWGGLGAFISLMISKWSAKRMMDLIELNPHGSYGYVIDAIREFARREKIQMPEVYYYESDELNAFATGPSRNNSLIAFSSGLLRDMNKDEIIGVAAHELAHITNGDMVTMTLVQGIVNAFVMFIARAVAIIIDNALRSDDEGEGLGLFAYFILVNVLQAVFGLLTAPIVAWFSRQREYRADAGGARLAGKDKMIAALEALDNKFSVDRLDNSEPSLSAMKISGKGMMELISTHPPIAKRIAALKS
jgi:heat shock protein HtpX